MEPNENEEEQSKAEIKSVIFFTRKDFPEPCAEAESRAPSARGLRDLTEQTTELKSMIFINKTHKGDKPT